MSPSCKHLLSTIANCRVCEKHLPSGPRPVVKVSPQSQIIVIGQAPGTKVHNSGIPRDDPSGRQLRKRLGVTDQQFADTSLFGIMPMGFCYPGKQDKGGDKPPRPECAPLWHEQLLAIMQQKKLILLIGMYAQKYYLKTTRQKTLTETVRHFGDYLPLYFPLPHPSRRSRLWQKRNPWFETEVLPVLQQKVGQYIV